MKFKKVLSICLVVLLSIAVFSACGKKDEEEEGTDKSATPITVVKDGESNFIIIKPDEYNDDETQAAISVFKAYKNSSNVNLKNVTDSTAREEGVYEIIIGNTNRPETAKAKELMLEKSNMYADEYIICAVNGNIVIYSPVSKNYAAAVEYYISTYIESAEIPGDLIYICEDTNAYNTVSVNGNTKLFEYSIVRSAYDNSYLTQLEIDALQTTLLEKTGYYVPVVRDRDLEAGEKEIIVGGSDREGQLETTDRDYYDVTVSGSKIYINGGSEYAVSVAVKEFTKALSNGNIVLNDGVYLTGSYAETVAGYDSSSYYSLKWSDEFEGNVINENNWHVCKGNEMTSSAIGGLTAYRSNGNNVFVKDGNLYQVGQRDDKGYYGGMLWTYDKMHIKYGYVEARMLIPDGDGFWIAMWLQGWNWPASATTSDTNLYAEIDIIESFGNASSFAPSLHRWPTPKGQSSGIPEFNEHTQTKYQGKYQQNRNIKCPDDGLYSDNFHTIGCMWTPESITITRDGVVEFVHDTTIDPLDREAFNHELFILISFANHFANCPVTPGATDWEWENTNQFIVDYIRVFQNDNCEMKVF